MGSVILFNAARMQAIEDGTVTTGLVDISGHLILSHRDGSTVDAGKVQPDNLAEASATVKGIVELATSVETIAGTDIAKAVTPAGVQARVGMLSNRNRIINGSFRTNQRAYASGTALAVGAFSFDRWKIAVAGANTFTATPQGQMITSTAYNYQIIERANIKAGNYVLSWVGTAKASVYNTGTNGAYTTSPIQVTLDGLADVAVIFATGTISEVQLEAGSTPSAFERISVAEELRACQRYYQRFIVSQINSRICSGFQIRTGSSEAFLSIPVPMRSPPTPGYSGSLVWTDGVGFNAAIAGISSYFTYVLGSTVLDLYVTFATNGTAHWPGAISGLAVGSYLDLNSEM